MPLVDRDDSVLIAIDAQPGFAGTTDATSRESARSREVAAWLTGVAVALDVPVVVTEEDAEANGPTDAAISRHLPPETPVLPKAVFELAEEPEILAAVESTGRRTTILVGAETDVCIAQSAIGLADRGFRVIVVSDATFSPGAMHDHGLAQLRDAGVEIRHAKGVYYEWVRTLAAARAFQTEHPDLASPPGFDL